MSAFEVEGGRLAAVGGELQKLPAFIRRDFLVAWSYRMGFISDLVNLVGQVVVFYFIGQLVDTSKLPTFQGSSVTYFEFAAVGIALGAFIQFGLDRVSAAMRGEQLMGTLESVLVTPTSPSTVQLGSVSFDLVYIPLRTALFLGAATLAFGLHFSASGILPALLLLVAFIPFVWGLGVLTAAAILTFRRGAGVVGLGTVILGLLSGLYFPLNLLPSWLTAIAEENPVALAIQGMRDALLGGAGFTHIASTFAVLIPGSASGRSGSPCAASGIGEHSGCIDGRASPSSRGPGLARDRQRVDRSRRRRVLVPERESERVAPVADARGRHEPRGTHRQSRR
jgi:ABC-2 type transport system permease protein